MLSSLLFLAKNSVPAKKRGNDTSDSEEMGSNDDEVKVVQDDEDLNDDDDDASVLSVLSDKQNKKTGIYTTKTKYLNAQKLIIN